MNILKIQNVFNQDEDIANMVYISSHKNQKHVSQVHYWDFGLGCFWLSYNDKQL